MKMLFFFVCLLTKKRIKINKRTNKIEKKNRTKSHSSIVLYITKNDEYESLSILMDTAAGPFIYLYLVFPPMYKKNTHCTWALLFSLVSSRIYLLRCYLTSNRILNWIVVFFSSCLYLFVYASTTDMIIIGILYNVQHTIWQIVHTTNKRTDTHSFLKIFSFSDVMYGSFSKKL